MKLMENGEEKKRAIENLIRIVKLDSPWSFGYFPTSAAAFHQWVYNGKPTQMVRNHIQYLRIDPEIRFQRIKEWNKPIYWPLSFIVILISVIGYSMWRLQKRRESMTASGHIYKKRV